MNRKFLQHSHHRIVLAAFTLLTLSACTVGPDFEKPPSVLPTNKTWQFHQQNTAETLVKSNAVADPIQVEWWNLFNDPILTSLEKRVASKNLSIIQASVRLGQSRALLDITAADQFPMLRGNGSYLREQMSEKGIVSLFGSTSSASSNGSVANGTGIGVVGFPAANIKPFSLWQYGFDASWEVDLWGRVRREIESAEANVEATKEAQQYTLISIMAELARDYIELRRIQRILSLSSQMVASAQEHLALIQQKATRGILTDLEVIQAKSQLASFQASIPALVQQESQAMNQLSFLLGDKPDALRSELSTPVPVPTVPPNIPIGQPSELARRRPDIRQAEAKLHAATADIGVSVADFYPRITLSGSIGLQGLKLKDLVDWSALQYAIGPSITVPIFQGGRLKATLELRKTEQQEAAIAHHNTVLQAWHEVDNALNAYAEEQRRNEYLAQAAQSSRDELELARMRYESGVSDYLPVLAAQKVLLLSEQEYSNSTGMVAINLVVLYKALGGGWEPII